MNRLFAKHQWSAGLVLFLAALLIATKLLQPDYGASGLDSLGRSALPYAFATAGMAIVVLAGGIDLSIAAVMAVIGVTSAVLMTGASDADAFWIVPFVLLIGAGMGAINGALIVLSRVPDIVVTLAMLFVWQGVALLVLNAPGGAAIPWLKDLIVGGVPGVPLLPKSLVILLIWVLIVWVPIRRSKLGLMIYAVGSDSLAAYRSGIPVGAVRIAAYALAGLFAGLAGLSLTLSTGIGEPIPGPYLLTSVAAVVLGGVALTGGRGGILGPILAVFILRLLRTDLTILSVDPNVTTIIEGAIMVTVVMIGGAVMLRGKRA
jgi:ribose transport system permease protein